MVIANIRSTTLAWVGSPHTFPKASVRFFGANRRSRRWLAALVCVSQPTWGHTPCVPGEGWRGAVLPLTPTANGAL